MCSQGWETLASSLLVRQTIIYNTGKGHSYRIQYELLKKGKNIMRL